MLEDRSDVLEIERRFLIHIPSNALLARYGARLQEMTQVYLVTPQGYSSERVRRSVSEGRAVLTHTRKMRIARETAIEEEREIGEDEYRALLMRADPSRRPVEKKRYAISLGDLVYEIDVYPFWEHIAVMEVELPSADTPLTFPEGIVPLREITGESRYSNHALALSVPPEPGF